MKSSISTISAVVILVINCQLSSMFEKPSDMVLAGGSRQTCSNEGETVSFDFIKNSCFKCICKNGFVDCSGRECPSIDGCQLLIPKQKHSCCNQCKGCIHNNRFHDSHSEWLDDKNPCKRYYCEAGIITESTKQCYKTACMNPIPPKPAQCCATCAECEINGRNVTYGRDVTIPEDPCLKCHCTSNRQLVCEKTACPVLNCAVNKQVLSKGECCPKCQGLRKLFPVPNICIVGEKIYQSGEIFHPDNCTKCYCSNETSICHRVTCAVLDCKPELQKWQNGSCCPHCAIDGEGNGASCTSPSGITYTNGEIWRINSCKSCTCIHGKIKCAIEKCSNLISPCPPNYRLIHYSGDCCPRCEELNGVCTVFGDPHYKTFDGKMFSFQGSCKYRLVEECSRHKNFSIWVKNAARDTIQSAWTRAVVMKFGNTKIILGQKKRVKLNGKKIQVPYKLGEILEIRNIKPDYRVENNETFLEVEAFQSFGVRIIWDGVNFLEVTANPKLKNKLCGLCGNFNFLAQDDFRMRHGKVLNELEIWKFAKSWKVGGVSSCDRNNEHFTRWTMKKKKCINDISPSNWMRNPCRQLTFSKLFGNCDSILNPRNYIRACLMDMCECQFNTKCYCQSFQAYVHECIRLGAQMPINWRHNSFCSADTPNIGRLQKQKQKTINDQQIFESNELIRNRRFQKGTNKLPLPLI